MYQQEKFAYVENKDVGAQVAHLPYKSTNRDIQFVLTVILPNKGVPLETVEQKLAARPALLSQLLDRDGTSTQELLLHLPKFKMEATFNLNDVLIQMGMPDAFVTGRANFTGIVSPQDDPAGLVISKVKDYSDRDLRF